MALCLRAREGSIPFNIAEFGNGSRNHISESKTEDMVFVVFKGSIRVARLEVPAQNWSTPFCYLGTVAE